MSRVLAVARILAVITIANFISGTFLVVCGFKNWDIAATVTTFVISTCTVHVEVSNKWRCIGKDNFMNTLILCVLMGGASAFFWFFHMIYKIGHYQGDYSELLWATPTKIIAFAVSVQLILKAHRIYTSLTLELVDEDFTMVEDATPLARTSLSEECNHHEINNNNNNPV